MREFPKVLTPRGVIETYPALTTSLGTLANWRSMKRGPRFFRVSRKVVYRASDVEDFLFRNPVLTADSVNER